MTRPCMLFALLVLFTLPARAEPATGLAAQAPSNDTGSRPRADSPSGGVQAAPAVVRLDAQQEIELALSAGPRHVRQAATVYVFGARGYEKVREGTNGFTCLVNRDATPQGAGKLFPTCWDAEGSRTIVPVTLRVGELLAGGKTGAEIARDIDAGFSDGRFQSPRRTEIAYMLAGDVELYEAPTRRVKKRSFPAHYMIYAPHVTNADIGMTFDHFRQDKSLPIVWSGYTGGAHLSYIIVPAVGAR